MAGTLKTAEGRSGWTQRAIVLVCIGLMVQLICVSNLTPATFLVLVSLGVGPVFVGIAIFARVVWVAGKADEADEQSEEGSDSDA